MAVRTLTKALNLVSLISHFFCCFLPGVVILVTMATVSGGVVTTEMFGVPEYIHEQMIYISAVMLVISGISSYISWKIDCSKNGSCSHEPCKPKKMKYFKLYLIAVVFFIFNVVVHFTLHTDHAHGHVNQAVHAHEHH